MWNMLWPVLIVVAANTFYNISAKSTPENIDGFASLTLTYLTAAVCSLVLFFVTGRGRSLTAELGKANWATFVLGAAIVGLEFGFICIYRVGWKISTAQLVSSLLLSVVLLAVGILFYKESISLRQCVGLAVCALGLFLLAK